MRYKEYIFSYAIVISFMFMCLGCSSFARWGHFDNPDLQFLFAFAIPILFIPVGFMSGLIIILKNRKSPFVSRHPWIAFFAVIFPFVMGAIFFIASFILIFQERTIDAFLSLVEWMRFDISNR